MSVAIIPLAYRYTSSARKLEGGPQTGVPLLTQPMWVRRLLHVSSMLCSGDTKLEGAEGSSLPACLWQESSLSLEGHVTLRRTQPGLAASGLCSCPCNPQLSEDLQD
jgi:hypothetical protein